MENNSVLNNFMGCYVYDIFNVRQNDRIFICEKLGKMIVTSADLLGQVVMLSLKSK